MKNILTVILVFTSAVLFAQFPNNPVKVRLGYQTTAKGLIYYGNGVPSSSPTGFRDDAFAHVDTLTNTMYLYDEGDDVWTFLADSTYVAGVLPVIDSTRLLEDSIVAYYQGGSEIGRDTLSLAVPETDPIYAADSSDIAFLDDLRTNNVTDQHIAYYEQSTDSWEGSNMYYDTANARLGIGTTTPSYKLDVNGTGRFIGALALEGVTEDNTIADLLGIDALTGEVQSRTVESVNYLGKSGTLLHTKGDILQVGVGTYSQGKSIEVKSKSPFDGIALYPKNYPTIPIAILAEEPSTEGGYFFLSTPTADTKVFLSSGNYDQYIVDPITFGSQKEPDYDVDIDGTLGITGTVPDGSSYEEILVRNQATGQVGYISSDLETFNFVDTVLNITVCNNLDTCDALDLESAMQIATRQKAVYDTSSSSSQIRITFRPNPDGSPITTDGITIDGGDYSTIFISSLWQDSIYDVQINDGIVTPFVVSNASNFSIRDASFVGGGSLYNSGTLFQNNICTGTNINNVTIDSFRIGILFNRSTGNLLNSCTINESNLYGLWLQTSNLSTRNTTWTGNSHLYQFYAENSFASCRNMNITGIGTLLKSEGSYVSIRDKAFENDTSSTFQVSCERGGIVSLPDSWSGDPSKLDASLNNVRGEGGVFHPSLHYDFQSLDSIPPVRENGYYYNTNDSKPYWSDGSNWHSFTENEGIESARNESATTSGAGSITVSHSLEVIPSVTLQNASATPYLFSVSSVTTTDFTFFVYDTSGSAVASTSINFDYQLIIP